MIYNQLNLQDTSFTNQSIGATPKIIVLYNNTAIHTLTGPVPVVDISYGFNNNNNNLAESLTTNINLNGKILRWPEASNIAGVDTNKAMPGFSGIMAGVSGLKNLFSQCPYGSLTFKCGDNILHEISGVRVTNLQFSNTEDNWSQTADYSISLEASERLWDGNGDDKIEKYVTERSDSWNIEPLDDAVYANFNKSITTRVENSNPKLGRPSSFGAVNTNTNTETNTLKIINIPQFRITRRLSAKGSVPRTDKICQIDMSDANSKPYIFAKAWVENMSKKSFDRSSSASSSPYFANPFNQNLFAFNHNRTINIDIFNGTYETNDTWLAMPSGVPYTETYSIEASTGSDFVKNVRIAGNIVGLSIANQDLMRASGVLPSGSGNNALLDAKLTLEAYAINGQSPTSTYNTLDAVTSAGSILPPSQSINEVKYENALNAWINHIKPFLYRRASLALNSTDRTLNYLESYAAEPPLAPNNPIYSKENLLSTTPTNTSEGHDPRKGTISYSYEYNNKFTIISGVITENINVSYDNSIDSTNETVVLGRAIGPIVQRVGRSVPRKTISVDIGIPPITKIDQVSLNNTDCPLHKNNYIFQTIEKIIEAHRPYSPSKFLNEPIYNEGLVYTSNDSEQWNPTAGTYSRSVSWLYQPINISQDFRDH
jgi:hypothetical protein